MRKGTKRNTNHKANEPSKGAAGKGCRKPRLSISPRSAIWYIYEDLRLQVFPVGTEWDQLDMVYEYKWNFSNLEVSSQLLSRAKLLNKVESYIIRRSISSAVQSVVSPFPPSDKIGIKSVQRETEEIVPMKQMKMDWVPYIPLEKRESQVERLKNSQIFILSCNQRRAGLRQLKIDRKKKFEYCLPYFYNPLQEDELEQSTVVNLLFPIDPKPVFCEFDWEFDDLELFTDDLIKDEELPADQKEPFKARQGRKKAREELSQQSRAAFENMKFYKFYPVPTPDTPDVSGVKVSVLILLPSLIDIMGRLTRFYDMLRTSCIQTGATLR
ncbi:hypothetical protein SASPL_138041 [Salvia splendens]|uniref:Uncharacterized protein n=1 Tax=Salvia splendens TaxID=180675 RepID=A0A8X8WW50_SALSN|nr:hypothetical protein SASPL_138041 [Salvia splendens]